MAGGGVAVNELCLKSVPSPENSGSAGSGCFDWRDRDQGLPLDVSNRCLLFFILLQKGENSPSTKHRKSG
jgi:hypothetical protein